MTRVASPCSIRSAEALTEWSEADALGRPVEEVFNIVHNETRAPALVPVEEVLRTGRICGLPDDTILLGRLGRETAVADSAAPIRDENGARVGVVLVFRDVTVEYAAQAQLRQTSERLRFILSATGAVVYSAQADSGRATYVSPNIEARFGYSPLEVFDDGWWMSRVHPDDLDGTPLPPRAPREHGSRGARIPLSARRRQLALGRRQRAPGARRQGEA